MGTMMIYEQGDFKVDDGSWKRCYPIPPHVDKFQDIVYDRQIQSVSYIQANIVGVFEEWFKSFFADTYFRTERIKTQSSFADFKTFMRGIYKKDKPILVIDPSSVESIEGFLFDQNMLNRYNIVDPKQDPIGAKLVYSLQLMGDETFELNFRRNRYKFEFSVMIMEQTMERAVNTYNWLIMNIRHNSKFMLERILPCVIPIKYIHQIARVHGFDWQSVEFLKYLNSVSQYPITKQTTPDGQTMFMFNLKTSVQVEVPGFPQKDSPEMSEAIEWGARVVDSFTMIADLPSEFLYLSPREMMTKFDTGVDEDPNSVYLISPIYADMDWPVEINGYKRIRMADIMYPTVNKITELDITHLILEYSEEVYHFVMDFIARNQKLSDLLAVRVYPNGSMQNIASELSNDGKVKLHNPKPNKIYTAIIYLNHGLMNEMREEGNAKYTGTIRHDPFG